MIINIFIIAEISDEGGVPSSENIDRGRGQRLGTSGVQTMYVCRPCMIYGFKTPTQFLSWPA